MESICKSQPSTHFVQAAVLPAIFARMQKKGLSLWGFRSAGWAVCLSATTALLGCSSVPAPHGEVAGEAFRVDELLQTDSNRITGLAMRDNLHSLWVLLDKLYQRNPNEWKKTAASRAAAVAQVRTAVLQRQPWAPLAGLRDVEGLSLALQSGFQGDRAAAFVYAAADTLVQAHGDKLTFTIVDGVDPQRLFNAARNMEIASWILNTRKNSMGQPLLLANHLSEHERNLSFEREMGKIIGRLDLLASFSTERYRRSVIGYGQGLVAGPFLQFLPVK